MRKILLFLFILGIMPYNSTFAITACPIPSVHMKTEYFSYSTHEARATLKDRDTKFEWRVYIRANKTIINTSLIAMFLRDNPYQYYAYEGPDCLGCSRYICKYFSPYDDVEFFAASNGNK